MPTYNVVFCGKLPVWPKDWDVGKSVKLIDCEFEKIDYASNDNVSVEVVVEADDEDEASEIGRQKCLVECDLFRLCYGYPIRLDFVHIQVDELSNSGRSYFSAGTVWAVDPKKFIASKELEDSFSLIRQSMGWKKEEDLDILRRSIRWHALGEMELDKIDRFIKFWVALEVLVSKQPGDTDVKRIKSALISQFPENEDKIRRRNGIIGRLYGLRKEIIHRGRLSERELLEPTQDLGSQLRQLEDILIDLLRNELNLPRLDLSKHYFI